MQVSIKKAKELIKKIILEGFSNNKIPLNQLVLGPPGVGKSSIVNQIRKEISEEIGKEVVLIDLRLAAIESSDLNGIPYVDGSEMKFSTPSWWPNDPDCYYILFLDEVTNALTPVQHAAYRLVLDRSIQNGSQLPVNCAIIGAGNNKNDNTGARDPVPAFSNRFAVHLDIDVQDDDSVNAFIEHFISIGMDPRIIGYLSWKRSSVYVKYNKTENAFATPRSWEFLSDLLKIDFDGGSVDREAVIQSSIGQATGIDFIGFMQYHSHLPNWKDVIEGATKYQVPDHDEGIKFAVATSLSFELASVLKDDNKQGVENLMEIVHQLPIEFGPMISRTIRMIGMEVLGKGTKYPSFREWLKVAGKIIRTD